MAKKSFSELINAPGMPVLVDFFAEWCGPCKAMSPVLQQLAAEHSGKLKIIKIDVDKNPAAARQFQVQGVPTLILFHQGKMLWRQSGAMSAAQLSQIINQHVK
jgi:thioredoxin 1